jgi:SAM-dependent methyltransferase
LTTVLVDRLGAGAVSACDPSPPFVAECATRNPGVEVRLGRAEAIPFDDGAFDCALAQLVLHFVSEPDNAAGELRRVVRPGGVVAACVWDFAAGMEMLRHFWDAALTVVPDAPDEAQTLRFGRPGEIADLFRDAGFDEVTETTLTVSSTYSGFDELWAGFLAGIGPAGSFCVALSDEQRAAVRGDLFDRLGSPREAFSLAAVARCAHARTPG